MEFMLFYGSKNNKHGFKEIPVKLRNRAKCQRKKRRGNGKTPPLLLFVHFHLDFLRNLMERSGFYAYI